MTRIKKIKLSYKAIVKPNGHVKYDYGWDIVKYDYSSSFGKNDRTIITQGRITEINQLALYKNISGKTTIDNIKDYCLDRFIKKSFTNDVVSFVVGCGYYGDEADYSINDSFTESLNEFIIKLNSSDIKESDLMEEILILEYGYILPELKNKVWEFWKDVKLNSINPAAGMRHVNKLIVNEYKKQYTEEKYNLTCVCEINNLEDVRSNKKLNRLIDGYHRYSAANQLKLDTIDIIGCY